MNRIEGYGVDEFARLAGLSRQWLYELWKQGRGPKRVYAPDKRGRVSTRRGRVVVPKAEGDHWITSHRQRRNSN